MYAGHIGAARSNRSIRTEPRATFLLEQLRVRLQGMALQVNTIATISQFQMHRGPKAFDFPDTFCPRFRQTPYSGLLVQIFQGIKIARGKK